jgi:putative transcriptional regulator
MRQIVLVSLITWSALLEAADLSQSHILVATPDVGRTLFGGCILVVMPIGDDQHVGFIVNRPTDMTLATVFPEHGPSQKTAEPVYIGGPVDSELLFALVRRSDPPEGDSVELLPGLYAVFDSSTVKILIDSEADTRFVAGLVLWRSGELAEEIEQGAWYVLDADASLAMRRPEGLWEDLARSSQLARDAI